MYKTDKGREVAGGGGIQPDIVAYPEQPDRLLAVRRQRRADLVRHRLYSET